MERKTALLSVFCKDGIVEFARDLIDFGWRIMASGGTAKHLRGAGLPLDSVEGAISRSQRKVLAEALRANGVSIQDAVLERVFEDAGKPILGHRVVTLAREVHAGILARMIEEDQAELTRLGLPAIGLVCVDMYPLADAIAKPGATFESVTEMTDIGGPTLLYAAAAKGGQIVIADPKDRPRVVSWILEGCLDRERFTAELAVKARSLVIQYQTIGRNYHASVKGVSRDLGHRFGEEIPQALHEI